MMVKMARVITSKVAMQITNLRISILISRLILESR